MGEKIFRVIWGDWRFRLSIGTKSLLAFLLIISVLAGGFYYFTSNTLADRIEKDALGEIDLKLKGAWRLYYTRTEQMKLGMLQAGSEDAVKTAFERADSIFLRKLLNDYTIPRPYVSLWLAVDGNQRIIGRRNGNTGDFVEINGLIAKALSTGQSIISTESVTREFLTKEDTVLASRVDTAGLMQVVVTPVESRGRIVGAFVSGILLNRYDWLPNSIFESFHINSALFTATNQESRVIASTLRPKSIFNPLDVLPEQVTKSMASNRKFVGSSTLDNTDVYIGAEPILNYEGDVIGGLAVGIYNSEVKRYVDSTEKSIVMFAGIGVLFSILLAFFVYRDTAKPIAAITGAMDEISKGNLEVRVEIKTKDEFENIGEGLNQMVNSIRIREERLDRFNELSKILLEYNDPEELLDKALTRMIELTDSNMGVVYIHDDKNESLKPLASYGVGEEELKKLKVGEGLAGKCASERKTIILQDITDANLSLETGFSKFRPSGLVYFPMNYKEHLNGVFVIGSLSPYIEDEIKHLEHLVTQIAIALDNALTHQEIEKLSVSDPLTGIYNRRHFIELLENEFTAAKRYKYILGIMMIDIDDFKFINDNFGHQQGDRVIVEVSRIMRDKTRSTDTWGRYGGEEFIGFASHCGMEGMTILAEKIRKGIEDFDFPSMNGRRVTVSIGVAFFPSEGVKDLEDLIKSADENLYKAKRSGKNRVVV
ncbi:MAG: diguanylate cyclase [Deltaproteobacteria bacterium]|nr:diguanylate cyclase [Deltaproteobacteria bacterium]